MNLHQRIADALGWTLEQTQSLSFHTLRELVRPVSAKLADEITQAIRSGAYVRQR